MMWSCRSMNTKPLHDEQRRKGHPAAWSSRGVLAVFFVFLGFLSMQAKSPVDDQPSSVKNIDEARVYQYLKEHPKILDQLVQRGIDKFLQEHPEAVAKAMERYQLREAKKHETASKQAIINHRYELYKDSGTPVVGPSGRAVEIVEFFDYRCAYCKRAEPVLRKLIAENPNIRMVYKELPVLGPESLLASHASMAAYKQEAFYPFHQALMDEKGPLTEELVLGIASKLGLDVTKFQQDMNSADVKASIDRTQQLASDLQIEATPTFVIGGELVKGVQSVEDILARVARAAPTE
jgi:protein-disulfide isomerase